jgi:hypothetical protein
MVPGRSYSPRYLIDHVRRHWFAVSAPVLVFGSLAIVLAKALPNVYYSQAVVQVTTQPIPENIVKTTVVASPGERLRTAKDNVLTTANLDQIIDELNLFPTIRDRVPRELLISAMRNAVRVELVKADTIVVGFSGYDPVPVTKVASRLLALFVDQAVRDRAALAENTAQFLETELEAARERLRTQELKVQAYREQHAGELPTEVDTNLRAIQATYAQLQGLEDGLRADRERRDGLEKVLTAATPPPQQDSESAEETAESKPAQGVMGDGGDGSDAAAPDPVVIPAGPPSRQLRAARAMVAALRLRLQPDHPDMQREISRSNVREVVRRGLEEARGNYKIVARIFNLQPTEYKRFLNFLRKHDCQLPFKDFRA